MANDNLNSFPKPSSLPPKPDETPDVPPSFEPTPDIIPGQYGDLPLPTEEDIKKVQESQTFTTPVTPEIKPPSENLSIATPPASTNNSPTSSLLTLILLILAGVGISASIFLYTQSSVLKKQLSDISKTLEQQKTVITPTPTPTIIEIPTPTPTPITTPTATPSANLTPTPSGTISATTKLIPFGLAPQALKIGLNHEPNAQLLLIKIDNANTKDNYLIKYFFRKDLTTKKYFYVTIDSNNESEIKTSSVYVNPDNNIPSLNDQVLGNKLGIDFAEAYKIVTDSCTKEQSQIEKCNELQTSAQFIQSGNTNIWQITLSSGNEKLIYQINSKTKELLYKPTK